MAQASLLLAVFGCRFALASQVADGKVHDLTAGSFENAINSYPLSFVEFYAPWCGHCKKLVPEWEEMATLLESANIHVAKVDAIAEKSLAEKHQVQSFPTLKLFRGRTDVVKKYEGPRTAAKLAEWAKIWQEGPILDGRIDEVGVDAASARRWASEAATIAVLGLKSGNDDSDKAMVDVLTDVGFALNSHKPNLEIPVAVTNAHPSVTDELKIPAAGMPTAEIPGVVVFRNFDFEDKMAGFRPKNGWNRNTNAEFLAWLEKWRTPALIPARQDTEKFFLKDIDPGHGLVLVLGGGDDERAAMHKLAVKFSQTEKKLKWVHAASDSFGVSLAGSIDLDASHFPEVAVWEFGETEDDDKVYRLSQQDGLDHTISEESVNALVTGWQKGTLSAEKDPVVSVTSDTFDSVVIKSGKDVLVEFYAPWCGHCKKLAPEYKKVARHYANDKGVSIVKVDATKHKHPSAEVKSYPTLKFYEAGGSGTPVDIVFKANRDSKSMIEFVDENRKTTPPKGKNKKKDKAKAESAEKTSKPAPPASASSSTTSGSGVWVFDDSSDASLRGSLLNEDMTASRNGFTLVRVGNVGVLLSSDGKSWIVRSFNTAAEAAFWSKGFSITGSSGAGAAQEPGTLPCPADADLNACADWCRGVSPALVSTLSGKACSQQTASDEKIAPPQCMCYDKGFSDLYAMCRSSCPSSCAAGDETCKAKL